MPTESQLRDIALRVLVRDLIEGGRLPVMLPNTILAGYGEGQLCLVCDKPITPIQIQYEVDHEFSGSHDCLRLHLGCHVIWQLECQKVIRERNQQQGGGI